MLFWYLSPGIFPQPDHDRGLKQAGVEVVECHETLWHGIEDRVNAASGGWLHLTFIWRVAHTYWCLLKQYRQVADYDILVVGYPGQLDVFLARLLTWWRRKPLVWDIFMSIYLISKERGLDKRSRFTISLLHGLEWMACRRPDRLILDTAEYVAWFGKTFGVGASDSGWFLPGLMSVSFTPFSLKSETVIPFTWSIMGHSFPTTALVILSELP